MPDVVVGLMEYLLSDATVTALTGANIFAIALEVPDDSMPQAAIVIKPHGGPSGPATLYINENRMLVQCFGATQHLAYVTYFAAYLSLKNMTPSVWANTYIHGCIPAGGPTTGIDTVLQWPFNNSSYIVKASDMAIT